MEYNYYPGCSVKGTGKHYEESLINTFKELNIELNEIEDWNCCGATTYMSINELKAFALAARNLSLAEKNNKSDLIAPCSACYLVLKKADDYIKKYDQIGKKILDALKSAGMEYNGKVKVKHPLELLTNDSMIEDIKKRVKNPLNGWKVFCYYGCQIVRPYPDFDDPRYPMSLDNIMNALGAEVVDHPFKTRCCGGSLTGTIEDVGLRLNYILLYEAQVRGANCVTTVCPLCQFNLECYQSKINKQYKSSFSIPVLYFSQIMGIAFGLPREKLGLNRSIISLKPLLEVA